MKLKNLVVIAVLIAVAGALVFTATGGLFSGTANNRTVQPVTPTDTPTSTATPYPPRTTTHPEDPGPHELTVPVFIREPEDHPTADRNVTLNSTRIEREMVEEVNRIRNGSINETELTASPADPQNETLWEHYMMYEHNNPEKGTLLSLEEAGVPMSTLEQRSFLDTAARAQANIMYQYGTTFHGDDPSPRRGGELQTEDIGRNCYGGAELVTTVVARRGATNETLAQSIIGTWMRSKMHRLFILQPYMDVIGAGVRIEQDGGVFAAIYLCESPKNL